MLYLFLLLVSISPATAPPTPVEAGSEPPHARSLEGLLQDVEAVERGGDLIFEDGFENGTQPWGGLPTFSAHGNEPEFILPTCDLPPGTYTFRVAADNDAGGMVYEYTMTVAATLCGVWPCFDISFSDPVITFR